MTLSLSSQEPEILPAKLVSNRSHVVPGHLLVTELFFEVPLDYRNPLTGSITLFGRSVTKHEVPIFTPDEPPSPKPYLVFLEGGPGFGNREPQDHPVTRPALARGYQVLSLDYRGVGLSTPVTAEMLARIPNGTNPDPDAVGAQARYLELMRQDNSVRDCEAVRKRLTDGWPDHKARWSLFGQSYGGFVSISYLSLHPQGLREVFTTGGMAPVGRTPEEVYRATFRKTTERNAAYFRKFPEDADALRQIMTHIHVQGGGTAGISLPAGGRLTIPRLLTLGIRLGYHGGIDYIHGVILQLKTSLDQHGFLTRPSLAAVEAVTPFDNNIIYAILHEAIYCDAMPSNWAAHRVAQSLPEFPWLRQDCNPDHLLSASASGQSPPFFSGEMIFPFHFDTHPELIALKPVAERLAAKADWPPLYDQDQLRKNQVPVYAATYTEDMFLDYDFARDTTRLIKGIKTFETNVMYHSALQAKSEEVIAQLFNLRDNTLD